MSNKVRIEFVEISFFLIIYYGNCHGFVHHMPKLSMASCFSWLEWTSLISIIIVCFVFTEKLAGRLQEYEIFVPQILAENGSFLNNELEKTVGSEGFRVAFHAFGEEFQLDLKRNRKLVDSRFTSEILDHLYQPPIQNSTRNCYYIGTVRYRPQSSVAISACHGLVRTDNPFVLFLFYQCELVCFQTVFFFQQNPGKLLGS